MSHDTTTTTPDDGARLAAATRSAVLAFWSVLAANLPDATTGDLSPDTAERFESAAADAAAAWYAANVTTGDRS